MPDVLVTTHQGDILISYVTDDGRYFGAFMEMPDVETARPRLRMLLRNVLVHTSGLLDDHTHLPSDGEGEPVRFYAALPWPELQELVTTFDGRTD